MFKLGFGIVGYAAEHDGVWPDRLAQVEDKVGGKAALAKLLRNPLTGDNPGYEYVKPQAKDNLPFGSQIMLYQLRGGKRDTTLKAAYADGSVRPYRKPMPPAEKRLRYWKKFSHRQGKFMVMMPGVPVETVQNFPTAIGKLKMTLNVVELGNHAKAFAVGFIDFPPGPDYGDAVSAHKFIDGMIAGVAQAGKGKTLSKSKIKLGSHHGQEILLAIADGDVRRLCRVYLVKNRIYELISDWSASGYHTSADAEKFMDSFKVTK